MSPAEVAADLADEVQHAVDTARLYRRGLLTWDEAQWLVSTYRKGRRRAPAPLTPSERVDLARAAFARELAS